MMDANPMPASAAARPRLARCSLARRASWASGACGAALLLMISGAQPARAQAQNESIANVGDDFVQPDLPLAYDRGQNTGVLDRERPEYEAQGIPLGGFLMHPRLQTDVGYTDNVYATPQKIDDAYFEIEPSVRIASNWARNELELDGGVDFTRYTSQTLRDQTDWHVATEGRYDFAGSFSLTGNAGTRHATEPATSAAYPTAAARPSQYQATNVQIAPGYAFGRIKLQAAYQFTAYSFDPYVTFGGITINQDNRDTNTNTGIARAEYALTPDTSVFVQGNFDVVDYSHELAPGVPNRDSHTYRGLAGVTFDIAAVIRGAVAAGYMRRDYQVGSLYPAIGGLAAEARIDWFPSTLTTVTLTGRRVIEDAGNLLASGFINSSVALRVDHELLRNLLLDAQAGYEHDSFRGAYQTADILRANAGARYLMNRTVGLGLSVEHDGRSAKGTLGLESYSETRVMFSIVLQK